MSNLEELNLRLHSLVVFRRLLENHVVQSLSGLLSGTGLPPLEQVDRYSAFAAALLNENDNLTDYLLDCVLNDENIYVHHRAQNHFIDNELTECLRNELKTLEVVSQLTAEAVQKNMDFHGYLPKWKTKVIDFVAAYENKMQNIAMLGYGMFAKHAMFTLKGGAVTPVYWPDPIRMADLRGYELQRQSVLDNTLALLKGKPAANVLLYGDAGTGKSSTVKALVNEFYPQGLRLLEVTKEQFGDISAIAKTLSKNPLKFILFIDDLSFVQENDDFNALKAALEGSASAKAPNLAIYATSNRRHLVKESFSDRNIDDIHPQETIQELGSLSERFGLSVGFFKPDRELYLIIVRSLAERTELHIKDDELVQEAERYALQRGGRSPRVARQFVEYLQSKEK